MRVSEFVAVMDNLSPEAKAKCLAEIRSWMPSEAYRGSNLGILASAPEDAGSPLCPLKSRTHKECLGG